jgi:hypothetical protein
MKINKPISSQALQECIEGSETRANNPERMMKLHECATPKQIIAVGEDIVRYSGETLRDKDKEPYRNKMWGTVEFMPSRENRSQDVFIMQDDMWEVATLRPTKNIELAKTGDATKRQVVTELTLCAKNEAANGIIADNTTS